jgi:hypothetical protein
VCSLRSTSVFMCGREMSDLISYRHRQETETAATNDPSRVPAQGEELGRFVEVALGFTVAETPRTEKEKVKPKLSPDV